MGNKKDKTIEKIENALVALVQNGADFEKLTVNDICGKAKVCRTTFYKYFYDKFEVAEKTQRCYASELVKRAFSCVEHYDENDEKSLIYFLRNNIDALNALFSIQTTKGGFIGEYKALIKNHAETTKKNISPLEADLYAALLAAPLERNHSFDWLITNASDNFLHALANVVFMFIQIPSGDTIKAIMHTELDKIKDDLAKDRKEKRL